MAVVCIIAKTRQNNKELATAEAIFQVLNKRKPKETDMEDIAKIEMVIKDYYGDENE